MRTYLFNMSSIRRSKDESAVGFSSYISGEQLKSERNGRVYNKEHSGVVYKEVMLPDHVPEKFSDRGYLWNSLEKAEKRRDASLGLSFLIGLNFKLPKDEIINILREYLKENFVSRGMICDFAIHEPDAGERILHMHMICPSRQIDDNGNWMNKRKVSFVPDEDGEMKRHETFFNSWDKLDFLRIIRTNWEMTWNHYLDEKGLEKIGRFSPKALGYPCIKRLTENVRITYTVASGHVSEVREFNDWIDETNKKNKELYLEKRDLEEDIAMLEKQHEALLLGFTRDLIPRFGKAQYTLLRDPSAPGSREENAFRILFVYGFRPGDRLGCVRDLKERITDYRNFVEKHAREDSEKIDEAAEAIRRGEAYNRDCLGRFRKYSSLPPLSKSVFYLVHRKDIEDWKKTYEDLWEHIGPDGEFKSELLEEKIKMLRIDHIEKLAELEELDFQLPILDDALRIAREKPGSYGEWLDKTLSEMDREASDDTVYISSGPVRSGYEPEL